MIKENLNAKIEAIATFNVTKERILAYPADVLKDALFDMALEKKDFKKLTYQNGGIETLARLKALCAEKQKLKEAGERMDNILKSMNLYGKLGQTMRSLSNAEVDNLIASIKAKYYETYGENNG